MNPSFPPHSFQKLQHKYTWALVPQVHSLFSRGAFYRRSSPAGGVRGFDDLPSPVARLRSAVCTVRLLHR